MTDKEFQKLCLWTKSLNTDKVRICTYTLDYARTITYPYIEVSTSEFDEGILIEDNNIASHSGDIILDNPTLSQAKSMIKILLNIK